MIKFIIAIIPVVAQFLFEELRGYFKKRVPSVKDDLKEMKDAIKSKDMDKVNRLYNATRMRNEKK